MRRGGTQKKDGGLETWEGKIKKPSRGEGGVVCFDVIASQAHPNRRREGESEVKAFGW